LYSVTLSFNGKSEVRATRTGALDDCFYFGHFLENKKMDYSFSNVVILRVNIDKNGLGYVLGDFFPQTVQLVILIGREKKINATKRILTRRGLHPPMK
jgi:hypothetical protein